MSNGTCYGRGQTLGCVAVEKLEARALLSATGVVAGVTLINADTDAPVSGISLVPGTTIDLGAVGHRLSIRADLAAGASVGSVRFNYDGDPNYRIENYAPYDIGGDANGGRDYLPWLPSVGMHTLIVTPYAQPGGAGQAGLPYLLLFNVIDSSTPAQPVYVNAGGSAYTDSSGLQFGPDAGFFGGRQVFSNFPVAGTTDNLLYKSRRQAPWFSFRRRVPDDTYAVTLYFADPGSPDRGRHNVSNVFDVSAEGNTLLDHFSIASEVGIQTAVKRTFIVPVTDGRIELDFRAEQGDAMVSAVSVVPQRVPLEEAPLYVNAGGLSFADSVGRMFEPGIGFTGGTTSQTAWPVDGILDPTFYSYRAGSHFSFTQPVANGDYELWLEMAEPTVSQPGQRVFDVSAEGQAILSHYDLVADAGSQHSIAKAFDVQVTGGKLDLDFTGVVGDAIVSSIVLIPKDIPASALPYAYQSLPDSLKMELDQQNLKLLGLDMIMFANNGVRTGSKFPPNIVAMVGQDEIDAQTLISPRTTSLLPRGEILYGEEIGWAGTLDDYIYVGAGKNIEAGSTVPLAYDNPDRVSGDINVLFADGHVGRFTRDAAAQLLDINIGDPTHAPPVETVPPVDVNVLLSQRNLYLIGTGAYYYGETAVRNGSSLPLDMGTISQFEDLDPPYFLNPRGTSPPPPNDLQTRQQMADWVNSTTDYIYVGAHKTITMPPWALVAYENPAAMRDGIDVLLGGALPQFREMRWAIETVLADRARFPRSYL